MFSQWPFRMLSKASKIRIPLPLPRYYCPKVFIRITVGRLQIKLHNKVRVKFSVLWTHSGGATQKGTIGQAHTSWGRWYWLDQLQPGQVLAHFPFTSVYICSWLNLKEAEVEGDTACNGRLWDENLTMALPTWLSTETKTNLKAWMIKGTDSLGWSNGSGGKSFPYKSDDLSSIPGHTVEVENQLLGLAIHHCKCLPLPHTPTHAYYYYYY